MDRPAPAAYFAFAERGHGSFAATVSELEFSEDRSVVNPVSAGAAESELVGGDETLKEVLDGFDYEKVDGEVALVSSLL